MHTKEKKFQELLDSLDKNSSVAKAYKSYHSIAYKKDHTETISSVLGRCIRGLIFIVINQDYLRTLKLRTIYCNIGCTGYLNEDDSREVAKNNYSALTKFELWLMKCFIYEERQNRRREDSSIWLA